VETNRVKPISWVYALVYPIFYLVTRVVYRREESDEGQGKRNREINKAMFSRAVYYGDLLIVSARKISDII
jgi:hypothetical protein